MKQLLTMYEQAQSMTPSAFLDKCTELLQQMLPFDKSMLVYGILDLHDLKISTVHLDRLPFDKLHKRLAITEVDPILSQAKLENERSVTLPTSAFEFNCPALYQHAVEFDQAHTLTFCTRPSGHMGEQGVVSLYRSNQAQPFSAHELALCDFFLPHIFVAYRINLRLHQPDSSHDCLNLIAAQDGRLYFLEERVAALLRQEWPEWAPPLLPERLLQVLGEGQAYCGQCLLATAKFDRDLVFIRLSARMYPSLTLAELKAARLVIQGLSYKETARILNVSPSTVSNQLQSAYKKLEVGNKIELGQKLQLSFEGHFV
ncbi:helix-turn-helix transcriptional regulator [Chitinibacter tainanensis]|uniref:helix-turn-helix transcriptional regulator n=1 Tax=Chitinibacter tainanensis TaxID=230667 RepID=UPI00041D1155|nr:helix-turn-helix transcriptional regulator [Chitinibacter tainanensis]